MKVVAYIFATTLLAASIGIGCLLYFVFFV
jgi:hypothetical protein